MKDKTSQQGFTLIEILVVVFIIGLLASVATYSFNTVRAKTRDTVRVHDIKQLNNALLMYYAVNGRFPQTTGSGSSWPETTAIPVLVPTYISKLPTSPSSPGNGCTDQHNGYNYRSLYGNSYALTFCIGTRVGSLAPGYYVTTNEGITKGRYDINSDGIFNQTDVGFASSAYSYCPGNTALEVCDLTQDGTYTSTDTSCLQAILNNFNLNPGSYDIFPLPPGQC